MSDVSLTLGVKLSLVVNALVDESAPLSRDGVIELVKDCLSQLPNSEFSALIDHVEIVDMEGLVTPGGVPSGLPLGAWHDRP